MTGVQTCALPISSCIAAIAKHQEPVAELRSVVLAGHRPEGDLEHTGIRGWLGQPLQRLSGLPARGAQGVTQLRRIHGGLAQHL